MTTQQTFAFLDPPSTSTSVVDRLPKQPAQPSVQPTPPDPQPEPRSPAEPKSDRESVLRDLRHQVGCINTSPEPETEEPVLSTGSKVIDRLLPRGGLRLDAMTEWVSAADGSGAASLAMIAAATHLRSASGPLVIVTGKSFYPPAAIALGIPAQRIILVQPTDHADVVWAIDQSLRCSSVAAVWAHLGASLDDRDARRFQLAAETGRTPGLFIRPAAVRHRPSFADVRFHVDNQADPHLTLGRRIKVTLDRCRGGTVDQSVWVQIDDQARILPIASVTHPRRSDHETAAVRLASELARPTTQDQSQPSRRRA